MLKTICKDGIVVTDSDNMKKSVDLRPVKPNKTLYANNKSVSRFLTAHQRKLGHSVPFEVNRIYG